MKYIIYIMVIALILYIPALLLTNLLGGMVGLIFSIIKGLWYIVFVKLWFISFPILLFSFLSKKR